MPRITEFEVTEQHLMLLKKLYIDEGEFGIPVVDQKRPFGNSDIIGDVAEMIGIEKIETEYDEDWPKGTGDKCKKVLDGLFIALQICLTTGQFKTGVYVATNEYSQKSWVYKWDVK